MLDPMIMASLIERKRHCLEQLHALGQQQLHVIGSGDIDGLFALLDSRQKWLDAFQRIEVCLHPFREQDPAQRRWPGEAHREKCRADQQRCQELLANITRLEEQGRTQLERQRDQMAQQLGELNTDRLASVAYASAVTSPPTGQHLDLSAET